MAFIFFKEIYVRSLCNIDEVLFITFLLMELKIFQTVSNSSITIELIKILIF